MNGVRRLLTGRAGIRALRARRDRKCLERKQLKGFPLRCPTGQRTHPVWLRDSLGLVMDWGYCLGREVRPSCDWCRRLFLADGDSGRAGWLEGGVYSAVLTVGPSHLGHHCFSPVKWEHRCFSCETKLPLTLGLSC